MTDADVPPGGVGIVVVAAGSGTRLGAEVPKAFVRVGGRPLLSYAVDRARAVRGLRSLVLVVPADYVPFEILVAEGVPLEAGTAVVAGGAERTDSVRAGLRRVDPACDVVLVHDAARAFTPTSVFDAVVDAVRAGADGVVPGLPVVDTIKVVDGSGCITGTPERSTLRAVQTPQGFPRELLLAAYETGRHATDDAALLELLGHRVRVVDGHPDAFKVTTPEDLGRAERLAR